MVITAEVINQLESAKTFTYKGVPVKEFIVKQLPINTGVKKLIWFKVGFTKDEDRTDQPTPAVHSDFGGETRRTESDARDVVASLFDKHYNL